MRLGLFLAVIFPIVFYAQNTFPVKKNSTNTFSSGSSQVAKFDNSARRFNDWAISIGGGSAFMAKGDLTSFYGKKINWGWNAYVSLDKQINHTFGIDLQYQMGETNQRGQLPGKEGVVAGIADTWTKYKQVSVLGDINFSNLLRRVDNHSPYRWALHGYMGIGVQGYKTELIDQDLSTKAPNKLPISVEQSLDIASFFYQGGIGLKYKFSKFIDVELRTMYLMSGDDEFDGGGPTREVYGIYGPRLNYNLINDSYSDDLITVNLGMSFKLGKHESHLAWHDPLQEAYYKTKILENTGEDFLVCEKGDNDNDGVCDDWDRQLDTPSGARVDGAGVALDMDLDGVIDLYDKCVTVPGSVENNGCPDINSSTTSTSSIDDVSKEMEGIMFELDSDKIRPQSFEKLNNAFDLIKNLDSNINYLVIGATDTRGSAAYNKKLSQRRAAAVVKYLTKKGLKTGMLTPEGRGITDLKYPECNPATDCPEWKNEANRRVYFQIK